MNGFIMIVDTIITLLSNILTKAGYNLEGIDLSRHIDLATNPEYGDYATNISFRLAKDLRKNPQLIAEELVPVIQTGLKKHKSGSLISAVSSLNGYINFRLDSGNLIKLTTSEILKEGNAYGRKSEYSSRYITVEHTSANPTKPLHIGHVRNAVLGDTVGRMYKALGYNVEILNYIDDMGRQMASIITAFIEKIHLKVPRSSDMKFDLWLGLVYAEVARQAEENVAIKEHIDLVMKNVKEDPKLFEYNRDIALQCVYSNLETTSKLNIWYDALIWESDIALSDIWKETFRILENDKENFGWETEGPNAGAFVAKLRHLPEFKNAKNPDKIIVRSNHVPTYVAHDTGLQLWKFSLLPNIKLKFYPLFIQKFKEQTKVLKSSNYRDIPQAEEEDRVTPEKVINVIGSEQAYLQDVIRHIFTLLNENEKAINSVHLSYKHVRLPERRFSGRSGNWFDEESWGDRVLEKTILAAYTTTAQKRADLSEEEKRDIASKLGTGALRYWLLKFSLEKEILFDYDAVTQLIGDTAPFIVYTTVRAIRILEKTPNFKVSPDFSLCTTEYEKRLVMHLATFPNVLAAACEAYKPLDITQYAYKAADLFNQFYENCPVNDPDNPERSMARILQIKAYYTLLQHILEDILGIDIPHQM